MIFLTQTTCGIQTTPSDRKEETSEGELQWSQGELLMEMFSQPGFSAQALLNYFPIMLSIRVFPPSLGKYCQGTNTGIIVRSLLSLIILSAYLCI